MLGGTTRAAFLYAAAAFLVPVSLWLEFRSLGFRPGSLETRPFSNLHTFAFLYTALLAIGAFRVRAREDHEEIFRRRRGILTVPAVAWALLGAALVLEGIFGAPGASPVRHALASVETAALVYALLVSPVLKVLLLRHARGGSALVWAQLVPRAAVIVLALQWGPVT